MDTAVKYLAAAALAGMLKVALRDVSLSTLISVAVTPPAVTLTVVASETKLVPVKVTVTLVPFSKLAGDIEVSVGRASPTENCNALLGPRDVAVTNSRGPVGALSAMANVMVMVSLVIDTSPMAT